MLVIVQRIAVGGSTTVGVIAPTCKKIYYLNGIKLILDEQTHLRFFQEWDSKSNFRYWS